MSEPVAAEESLAVEERLIDRSFADLEIGEHLGAREVQSNAMWQTPYIQTVGVVLLLLVTFSACAGWVMGGSPKTSSPHQIELRAAQAELLVHRASKGENKEVEQQCHTAEPGESCYSLVRWSMKVGIREHPAWYHSGVTEDSSFEEVQASLALAESSGCPDPCGSVHLHYDRNTVRSHRTTEEDVGKVVQKKAKEDIENSLSTTPKLWTGPGGRPLTATEVNEMEAELNYQGFTNPLNDTAEVTTKAYQWRGPGGRPLTPTEVNEMEAELNYQGFTDPLNDTAAVTTTVYQWRGPGGRPLTPTEVNEMEAELNYQGYTNPLNDSTVTTTMYRWRGPGGRRSTAPEVNEMEAELNYQGYTDRLIDGNSTKAAATFENGTALQQISN